ncbi:MAG: discoidin domain-containing protein [Xanthomonadales bacterium]|nr:discoidin domain-containing protein [Xanthomonadales bacterium]
MKCCWALAAMLCAQAAFAQAPRVLDDFDAAAGWEVVASDQVAGTLRTVGAGAGKALCLSYDFHGVSGYVGIRKRIPLAYPGNYAFDLRLRGQGPRNDFQFKLVDASGDNVWWVRKPMFAMPADWTPIQFRKRHIAKAWGPAAETVLASSAMLEFTLASGEGGKGEACFDALGFRALPAADDAPLVGNLHAAGQGAVYDLGRSREFGGAILHWAAGQPAGDYRIELSDDAHAWRRVREVRGSDGGEDFIPLPEQEARYLRIVPSREAGPRLQRVDMQPLAFSATTNDFLKAVAARAPRGTWPRGFSGEQPYWTIVGIDGGSDQGLIGEDGAIELGKGAPSVEPFVVVDGKLVTWADVQATQSLQDGYLPIPSVHWKHAAFALDVTALASGTPALAHLHGRYRLTNVGNVARDYVLVLAARPLQVNPPTQFLSVQGGYSRIDRAVAREGVLIADGHVVQASQKSGAGVAATFDQGELVGRLRALDWRRVRMHDGTSNLHALLPGLADEAEHPQGLASAALLYPVRLQPGESREFDWRSLLQGEEPAPTPPPAPFSAVQQDVAAAWREKLDRVRIVVPPAGQRVVDTLRTALAHMLISRTGPRLQPGTRSYARAWIRDGAMINEGLLRLGREDVAGDFLRWYAPYQFDSGKVPCCVDDRGSDPVPENDSHGELVYAIAEQYRYTRDRALLEAMWPHVVGAVKYMDELRLSERTQANRARNPAFFGLMPASISHEGYSAKPMHSYWDDFWALRGYKDAVEIAQWLGKAGDATRFAASRDQFRDDLYASLDAAMQQHGIDFLPGAAELGDFDATSTTIALAPGGEQARLPQGPLRNTFERYWREFVQRRDGTRAWKDYTPYELRTIGSFVRLGWRDRAHEALDFFFRDRQPPAWNQWAEVVSRTPRVPFFVGDLPHAWVESDYVRSALDLFAYGREQDDALVVGAGIPADWLHGKGVAVEGLRTPHGTLAYTLRAEDGLLRFEASAGLRLPGGGLVLSLPAPWAQGTVDGQPIRGGEVRITRLPVQVEVRAPR